jgi:predicted house-cleaning noncanonical NTP pyrophosphatase (MazG superfamily)
LKTLIGDKDESADILKKLLGSDGMNYGQKPKGLLAFHSYPDGARTPLEEHLVEAAAYASNGQKARLHFTVSPEHRSGFEALVAKISPKWSTKTGIDFEITFSEQKPATDTIAVNPDNTLFRETDGSLLFRPAGHGALLENLNDLVADVIFIKNIDNVVPDALKQPTIEYKKALGGLLLWILEGIEHLDKQLQENPSEATIKEALEEMATYLGFVPSAEFAASSQEEKITKIREVLARPTRVCGVVKNTGEPGGGPFWCQDARGNFTLQLVESAQIDMKDEAQKTKFHQASHFNPVDLVCATRGLDLLNYRDMHTGFITDKTKDGKELKAMELPGLWNGAMSDWNTLFVEVPLETFNPVKTVTDLVRPAHQSS